MFKIADLQRNNLITGLHRQISKQIQKIDQNKE
jgi:hypothetical protein